MINTRTVLALLTTVALVVPSQLRAVSPEDYDVPVSTAQQLRPRRYVLLRRQWQRHRNQRRLGFAVVPALLQLPALRLGYELQRRRVDTSDG